MTAVRFMSRRLLGRLFSLFLGGIIPAWGLSAGVHWAKKTGICLRKLAARRKIFPLLPWRRLLRRQRRCWHETIFLVSCFLSLVSCFFPGLFRFNAIAQTPCHSRIASERGDAQTSAN